MAIPVRSFRLIGRPSGTYTKVTGENGEIFYDATSNTLRVFDGRRQGGNILADRGWVLDNIPEPFSGDYNDLTNTPTIPSLSGYATEDYVTNLVSSVTPPGGFVGTSALTSALSGVARVADIATDCWALVFDWAGVGGGGTTTGFYSSASKGNTYRVIPMRRVKR